VDAESPFPAIWIPQENLGLFTDRTPGAYSDNVDALDVALDCNLSSDLTDIVSGASPDCNANLIPDECDLASGGSIDADADGVPDECLDVDFVRGDCDGDGFVGGSVTDPVFYLNWAFGGGETPGCRAACDANGDGFVGGSVADPVYFLNWAFYGGPAPPAPHPACGPGTEDDVETGCAAPPAGCAGA
jgi:hypothetical protein